MKTLQGEGGKMKLILLRELRPETTEHNQPTPWEFLNLPLLYNCEESQWYVVVDNEDNKEVSS